jgi:hypothetical protein
MRPEIQEIIVYAALFLKKGSTPCRPSLHRAQEREVAVVAMTEVRSRRHSGCHVATTTTSIDEIYLVDWTNKEVVQLPTEPIVEVFLQAERAPPTLLSYRALAGTWEEKASEVVAR